MRLVVVGLFVCCWVARAGAADHDPRPLTTAEQAVFVPLVCGGAIQLIPRADPPYSHRCATLIGYPGGADRLAMLAHDPRKDMRFPTVSYGSFTQPSADEAYVSYDASFAPHVEMFGGGILFRHNHGSWRLVAWFPAERRAKCIALPGEGKQEMLCLEGDGHATSSDEDVTPILTAQNLDIIPGSANWVNEYKTVYKLERPVFAMRDNNFETCADRKANLDHIADTHEPCSGRPRDVGFLIEITGFKRSPRPGALAEASVVYAAPADVEKACRATCYLDARQQTGVVVFSLQGKRILVTMPGGLNLRSAIKP
jgi:hypothetical protein